MPLTVLICDDHRLFADAMALALRKFDFEVAAVTHSAAEALEILASCTPDVCLVDRNLPDGDGVELARAIRAAEPGTRVLLVSGSRQADLARLAVEAGAAGFVSKEVGMEHLARALRRAHDGLTVDEPGLTSRRREARSSELARLMTCRERAVLERLVQGNETTAIASQLGISYTTARTYIQNLLRKLGVHSKLELVTLAVEHRLVPPPGRRRRPRSPTALPTSRQTGLLRRTTAPVPVASVTGALDHHLPDPTRPVARSREAFDFATGMSVRRVLGTFVRSGSQGTLERSEVRTAVR